MQANPSAAIDVSPQPTTLGLRALRASTQLSQRTFAARLGLPSESYRAWESGRRSPPADVLNRAAHFASVCGGNIPMPLAHLATVLGVSEMTLRNAARSGRLRIQDAKFLPGKPILRATREDGEEFLANSLGKSGCRSQSSLYQQSLNYRNATNVAQLVRQLRTRLRLSQCEFARLIGAANRAVVYQWESDKRQPSPAFCLRLVALGI